MFVCHGRLGRVYRSRALPARLTQPWHTEAVAKLVLVLIGGLVAFELDDATADAAAGVAGGLAAVVGLFVDDDGAADDGVLLAVDGDVIDGDLVLGDALGVGREVAEVAGVALGLVGEPVLVLLRVVVAAGLHAVGAALGAFVHVHGVLLVGGQAFDPGDNAQLAVGLFDEADSALGLAGGRGL